MRISWLVWRNAKCVFGENELMCAVCFSLYDGCNSGLQNEEWMVKHQCKARLGSLVFWTEIWKWPKVKCFVNESTWLNPGLMDAASKVSHDRRMVFLMCCAMLLCGLTANPENPIARSVRPFLVWVKFYGSFSVGCCDRILWNAKPKWMQSGFWSFSVLQCYMLLCFWQNKWNANSRVRFERVWTMAFCCCVMLVKQNQGQAHWKFWTVFGRKCQMQFFSISGIDCVMACGCYFQGDENV